MNFACMSIKADLILMGLTLDDDKLWLLLFPIGLEFLHSSYAFPSCFGYGNCDISY